MKYRQKHYGEYCMIMFCVGDWSIQIEYLWLQYLYNVKCHDIPAASRDWSILTNM